MMWINLTIHGTSNGICKSVSPVLASTCMNRSQTSELLYLRDAIDIKNVRNTSLYNLLHHFYPTIIHHRVKPYNRFGSTVVNTFAKQAISGLVLGSCAVLLILGIFAQPQKKVRAVYAHRYLHSYNASRLPIIF